MESLYVTPSDRAASRVRIWLGVALLAAGLLGHLLSARAIGGYYVAYRDHILGFFLLTIVTGVIIAALGWRFWRGRHDITLLALGAAQAVIGYVIWLGRFNIH